MTNTPTLATRLTAEIPAAIATIAVRGPAAIEMVERFLVRKRSNWPIGAIRYEGWRLPATTTPVTEHVVVCRTDETTMEVHCHGGNAVCRAILNCLDAAGCQIISQQLWTVDLLKGRGDHSSTCEQAAQDLLQATTDRAAAVLLDQMSGAFAQAMEEVNRQRAEGQIQQAIQGLQELLTWADFGLHLTNPWQIVLAGPPNVGKSSLMNALVGQQRAIVHHEPGTTRDWIECRGALEGWPVSFTDTAGVRDSHDSIEQQGVERSWQRLREADLVVLVVDALQGWTDLHSHLRQASPSRTLIAWNKVDLLQEPTAALEAFMQNQAIACPEQAGNRLLPIQTSSRTAAGVNELLTVLAETLVPRVPKPGAALPFRPEHVADIERSLRMLNPRQ